MSWQVRDNPEQQRYEIVDGDTVGGFLRYVPHGERVDFVHTQVDPEHRGEGLAATLVSGGLDDARRRGLMVRPYCPFVHRYLLRHPEYHDVVAAADRAAFGLQ